MDQQSNPAMSSAPVASEHSAPLDRTTSAAAAPVLERVVVLRASQPSWIVEALDAAARRLPTVKVVTAGVAREDRNRELVSRYGTCSPRLEALADALDAIRCLALHIEPIAATGVTVLAPDFWLSPWKSLRSAPLGGDAERLILSLPAPRLIVSLAMTADGAGLPLPAGVEEIVVHPTALIDRLPGLLRERALWP